jgi:hypothetical protein
VVAHLADSALASSWRIRLMLAEDSPTLSAFDQDAWTWPYSRIEPRDALATLSMLRRDTALLLRLAPTKSWQRTGYHEERGKVTVRDLVERQINHIEEHLAQIRSIKRELSAPRPRSRLIHSR